MNRYAHLVAAMAASLSFAAAGAAQDDAAAETPDTYSFDDGENAIHGATGAVCPKDMGDLVLIQVLSFDREEEHLGIGCQYGSPLGFSATISVLQSDEVGLVGAGDSAARWNRQLYTILGSYPGALPANVSGLEGDPASSLRGALFTANANGLPVRVGVWQIDAGDWQYSAQTTFAPTSADTWALAQATRAALLSAKAAADAS